jgi:hypothetical protein
MMRKIILVVLVVNMLCFNCFAVDFAIFDLRNKIFSQSKEIKLLISNSENPMLVSSIWDTCTIIISEIDAYFSMLAIFNSVKKEAQTREGADYLIDWLNGIKKTNELNIKNINNIESATILSAERKLIEKLKDIFIQLQEVIGEEISKVTIVRASLRR